MTNKKLIGKYKNTKNIVEISQEGLLLYVRKNGILLGILTMSDITNLASNKYK